jgi:hypothetical protein
MCSEFGGVCNAEGLELAITTPACFEHVLNNVQLSSICALLQRINMKTTLASYITVTNSTACTAVREGVQSACNA